LIEKGYQNIHVLDISANAIERVKKRLGKKGIQVLGLFQILPNTQHQFDLWHDRAAFHFLTTEDKIYKYIFLAEEAIKKNGYLILGTFSEKGPRKCSGLEIKQYSKASMSTRFEVAFDRIKCTAEDHLRPLNTIQNFLFCSFKKVL
jgi:hypothetical protein